MMMLVYGLVGLLVVVNLLMAKPSWWIGVVVFVTFGSFPAQVPERIYVGGFGVNLSELALILGAAYVAAKYPPNRLTDRCAAAISLVTAFFAFIGVLSHTPMNQIANDSRGLFGLSLALFIAGRIAATPIVATALKSLRLTLWVSFAIITLGSLGALEIQGRLSAAALDGGAAADSVTRVQSPTVHIASAVLAICIALWIVKPHSFRPTVMYMLPALGITILGFSRNALLTMAITCVVAIILERTFRAGVRATFVVAGMALVFSATGALLERLSDLPGLDYVHRVYSAYTDRVFGGLSADVMATDSSTVYRDYEITNMKAAINGHELAGHGMGYEYQPVRDSKTPTSSYYAHNFYMWSVVKTGFIGLSIYAVAFLAPLVRAVRGVRPAPFRSVCVGAAVGLLYVSSVAPLPLSSNGGPLIGTLIGAAAAMATTGRDRKDHADDRELPLVNQPA